MPQSLEGLVIAHLVDTNTTRLAFAQSIGCSSWRTRKDKLRGKTPLTFNQARRISELLNMSLDSLSRYIS